MVHEINQFDIPDRQLLVINSKPRVGLWTDIGEAKITHTIFGRANVRVIREQDKKRRARLLVALAVAAMAATAWQGWIASQQTEPLAAPPLPLSERIRVSAPVFQPEDTAFPATASSARSKPRTPTQIVIDSMTTRREPPPQPPSGSKAAGQMAAKPITSQLLTANKPQAASFATNNNLSKYKTDMQQPPKLSAPIQPAAQTDATPPATQPSANSPATAVPLVEPLTKHDTQALSPAGDNQPSGSVSVQP